MYEKELKKALEVALAEKGKRKFKQSLDIIVNLTNVDFSKPENRINLDVFLPNQPGREYNIVVFAEGQAGSDAKNAGATVFGAANIEELKANPKELKRLASNSIFLAQPQLMAPVAKSLGFVLGRKGKLPKPLTGNISQMIDIARRTVKLQTKGKYLPTLMSLVGKEDLDPEQLTENAATVMEAIIKKIPSAGFKSVYLKLTMGKPVKVI